ncbi:MAG TPA: hypothetical protein VMH83_00475 [Candidatus Acidoferrum sp.]|nr:hypothetical protein [Candidatus Acidoferrum sp.]
MKKLVIATLMFCTTNLALADYKLVSGDASDETALCIAAANTSAPLEAVAAQFGIGKTALNDVSCNGMTVSRFRSKYGSHAQDGSAESKSDADYVIKKADDSPLTALCAAAASSDQEFLSVKSLEFRHEPDIEAKVECNGVPLPSFVRKFRTAGIRELSQR